MRWVLVTVLIIMLLGPLRRWLGRHWAFLISVFGGAAFGFFLASFVMSKVGYLDPVVPLLSALIASIAAGRSGPAILRKIERDGKDERVS